MEITKEQVEEFYEFLQGTSPKDIHIKFPIKLSKNKAFSIIYYLQEHLRIIPDNFEQCCVCKEIRNSREEGVYIEKKEKWYCDNCRPD